jgi:hypothetical protein
MIVLGPLLVFAAVALLCWLMFTLAVFALPLFAGVSLGIWAYHSGAGALGGVIVGAFAGGMTFGVGRIAMAVLPSTWLRLLIVLLFVAPAAVAGYSATHGIVQMTMPSAAWQMFFSAIGAIAVAATAFIRFTGLATPGQVEQGSARG